MPPRQPRYRIRRLNYSNGYFEPTPANKTNVTIPKAFFVIVAIGAGLAFIVWFFTGAPWLKVKDIQIDGAATEATIAEIEKLRGQNILWLSVTRPEKTVTQRQPSIKEIQILRGIPDTLRVKLIERTPAAIWQSGDSWYTLDPSGFIFRAQNISRREDGSLDYPGTDLPIVVDTKNLPVKIGQTLARPQFISFISDLRQHLPEEFQLRMIRAEINETTFNLTTITDAGWSIHFDTTRNLDPQLRTLAKVLESKRPEIREYIDVRVRGWVYYK